MLIDCSRYIFSFNRETKCREIDNGVHSAAGGDTAPLGVDRVRDSVNETEDAAGALELGGIHSEGGYPSH
jgi:hypothetical protein